MSTVLDTATKLIMKDTPQRLKEGVANNDSFVTAPSPKVDLEMAPYKTALIPMLDPAATPVTANANDLENHLDLATDEKINRLSNKKVSTFKSRVN